MKFIEIPLKGAYVIEAEPRVDERGSFARAFCRREFIEHNLRTDIMQCNISQNNRKGILRGMHYQLAPFSETKIVRCTAGMIYDVIIDVRPDSPTFLKWFGIELTSDNQKMLYVPEGFAHGYVSLTDNSEVFYMVTQFYTPESERGIRWDDPLFKIKWPVSDPVVSVKDANYQDYKRIPDIS